MNRHQQSAPRTPFFIPGSRLESDGTTTYSFDPNGNQLIVETPTGDITTYSWSYENQLIQIEEPDDVITTQSYAPINRKADELRIAKETDTGIVHFIWDDQNIIQEVDDLNTIEAEYTLNPQPYGDLVSQRREDESTFYNYDALGSTQSLTDPTGTVDNEYSYDAFGKILSQTGHTDNPFSWIGQLGYYQDANGQYNLRAREYEQAIGRFLSEDPLGFAGSDKHHYRYANNNPITGVDPSGKDGLYDVYDYVEAIELLAIDQIIAEQGAAMSIAQLESLAARQTILLEQLQGHFSAQQWQQIQAWSNAQSQLMGAEQELEQALALGDSERAANSLNRMRGLKEFLQRLENASGLATDPIPLPPTAPWVSPDQQGLDCPGRETLTLGCFPRIFSKEDRDEIIASLDTITEAFSMAVSLVPGLGEMFDILNAWKKRDVITEQDYGELEAALARAALFLPIIPDWMLVKLAKPFIGLLEVVLSKLKKCPNPSPRLQQSIEYLEDLIKWLGKRAKNAPKGVANFTTKQLEKKWKHAVDFGITTTKRNPTTLAEYQAAIMRHLDDTGTVIKGTYGWVENSVVHFNPKTYIAVVLDDAGNYITGFKIYPGTDQFDNYIKNGFLR